MRNYAKAFHVDKGYKLAIVVFIPTTFIPTFIPSINLWYKFQTLFSLKRGLSQHFFYLKTNYFNIVWSVTF